MLVIRRMDDGKRSYTAIFLPGEPARIFPTSNQEHARILQIYKQDRPYPDILNDSTEYQIGQDGRSPQPHRNEAKGQGSNGDSAVGYEQELNRQTPTKKKRAAGGGKPKETAA